MTMQEIHLFITTSIILRLAHASARREEALREILSVSHPGLDDAAIKELAALVPELPARIHEKWVLLFADRLLETTPKLQLEELCSNTEENNGALMLLYSMFMESERMEKIVAEDLASAAAEMRLDEKKLGLASVIFQKSPSTISH